jgi:hypothetical protein
MQLRPFKTLKTGFRFMVIPLSKEQMELDIFNLLKSGTTEKEGIHTLDYKTIEEFWKQKK